MTPSLVALTGFAVWTLILVLAVGLTRSAIVLGGSKKANEFKPSGEDIEGMPARLTRAHANCYENLPVFAALIAAAGLSGQFAVSDPWAMYILYARFAQSIVLVQMGLMGWIALQLLM